MWEVVERWYEACFVPALQWSQRLTAPCTQPIHLLSLFFNQYIYFHYFSTNTFAFTKTQTLLLLSLFFNQYFQFRWKLSQYSLFHHNILRSLAWLNQYFYFHIHMTWHDFHKKVIKKQYAFTESSIVTFSDTFVQAIFSL